MKFELFIARKIHFNGRNDKKRPSPAVKIATWGIALGMAVMIIAVAIVIGFKHEVAGKAIGFGSHIQISGINENSYLNAVPISVNDSICKTIVADSSVKYIQRTAIQSGVLKSDSDFVGVILKGVDKGYDRSFFEASLSEGKFPDISGERTSEEVLISRQIANKMRLGVGSGILCYFIKSENIKVRKLKVAGIYSTNFTDYDELYIVGDLRLVQGVNSWDQDQYTSLEIKLNNFQDVKVFTGNLYYDLLGKQDCYGVTYFVKSIYDMSPQLFNWLDLLDMNVWIIIILMSVVAGFTIVSGILIIILERTSMIGTLKALGSDNISIRKIFLYLSSFLIIKGLLLGNIIGLAICLLQSHFKILKLDPAIYYIPAVTIELNWWIIPLNIGSLIISLLMVIIPTYLVTRIRPAETIKFE
ncbi:MAG: ABC transporter permease [Bacteroidales bacterium]